MRTIPRLRTALEADQALKPQSGHFHGGAVRLGSHMPRRVHVGRPADSHPCFRHPRNSTRVGRFPLVPLICPESPMRALRRVSFLGETPRLVLPDVTARFASRGRAPSRHRTTATVATTMWDGGAQSDPVTVWSR